MSMNSNGSAPISGVVMLWRPSPGIGRDRKTSHRARRRAAVTPLTSTLWWCSATDFRQLKRVTAARVVGAPIKVDKSALALAFDHVPTASSAQDRLEENRHISKGRVTRRVVATTDESVTLGFSLDENAGLASRARGLGRLCSAGRWCRVRNFVVFHKLIGKGGYLAIGS